MNWNDEGGIASVIAYFGSAANSITTSYKSMSPMTLFAGTDKAGTWRAVISIPSGTSGTHYVGFKAVDTAGNETRIAWAILDS